MRQKDLAASLTLDSSSVVRLLDAIEAAGLIKRREKHADRRTKIITLTAQGRLIIDKVEAASREIRNKALAGLSGDEIELASGILEVICLNLENSQEREE